MALHASWKGYLQVSLVSVPLQAYTAAAGSSGTDISFHQLHATCKNRIQYKKFCPIHGEVSKDEIVSGYEVAKDQYAVIDPAEIAELRTENDKSIKIDGFVAADAIDPLYLSGQAYYLVPDGRVAEKPYSLIRQSLADENVQGVGQFVIARRQRLVRLRATDSVLMVDVLYYEGEMKQPGAFEDQIHQGSFAGSELKLTKSLLRELTLDKFAIGEYKDDYSEHLRKLVEAKAGGKELVVRPNAERPQVINLMDALKQSLKLSKTPERKAAPKKPSAKMAVSARSRDTRQTGGRRKSG